jgi:GntR family transcriptional regulator
LGDRRSIVLQLRDEIQRFLEEAAMVPGTQLPSESQLSEEFGVARGTVREALKLLEQDGLINVYHGRGRFVSALGGLTVDRPITHFESATDMLVSRGYQPRTRVLSVQRVTPDREQRSELVLGPDEDVIRLERLRLHKRKVFIYAVNTFAAGLLCDGALEEQDFSGSLNDWLAARGRRPVSSAARIQASELPQEIASEPDVDWHGPWLLIVESCVDASGAVILHAREYYRGDVFSFHMLRRAST